MVGEVQSIDWHTVFASDSDPSDMFDSFYSRISKIIDKYIPLKQLSKKELKFRSKPWISRARKVSIHVKNQLYKKYLKTKSPYYYCKFKYYRNKLNHPLKISKKQYYNNFFLENIHNSKRVWTVLASVISKPLEARFNASFSTEIPSSFKIANVIPIYKKGSYTSLSNYRPISLLSVFNKLLEKLMCNRLVNFLKTNKAFFDNQFGFRAGHSTNHAILSITDKIQRAINNKEFSCGMFLDFSKAFDTINHDIVKNNWSTMVYVELQKLGSDPTFSAANKQ